MNYLQGVELDQSFSCILPWINDGQWVVRVVCNAQTIHLNGFLLHVTIQATKQHKKV